MKYESELKSQQVEVHITHLSKQIEALSSSLWEKQLAAAQLQSELQTYKEVANTPEQLLGSEPHRHDKTYCLNNSKVRQTACK